MKKKFKKVRKKYEPQKAVFGDAVDYYVYHMNTLERMTGAAVGFLAGFFVCMVFFRGILFSAIVGLIMTIPGIRKYREYLKQKRLRGLLYQFRDMMEALSASYSAGKNTQGAFEDACADLSSIYGERADIVMETRLIVSGLYNGQNIDDMLNNFALRSHLDDIESFATIFEVTNQYGGNLKKVVGETRQIISDKIETEMEIQTLLTANKNELNIMTLMPVIIMVMLSGMGDMSIVRNTPLNVCVKIVALVLFGAAYVMGKKIVDIKV
ncbi:MAG: type II secretion system F family protein [Eubacteriales bacterium]|nr:type II secretion system F family protein [Eubacteriales bacterium]